jgi:dipeptidyl aminopeptidase/acylaminoacyl peptidase
MNELKELFELITTHAEPDQNSWKEQERRQRRSARNRKLGAIGLAAALIAGAVVFAAANLRTQEDGPPLPADTGSPHPSDTGSPHPSETPSSRPSVFQPPLGLAIVGLDGSVRQDLGFPSDAWMPDLSSDGTQIMFFTDGTGVAECGGCSNTRVAAVRVGRSKGGFIFLGVNDHIHQVGQPVWSPDGHQIAFVGVDREGNRDIYIADGIPDVDEVPYVGGLAAETRRLTFDPAVDEFPAWSPDGSTIFYDNGGAQPLDDLGFSSTQEIWRVPADGGTPQRLTNNEVADAQADVSADGVVAYSHDGDVWTMDQDGGNPERMKAVPPGAWFSPRWSPDGTMLALLRHDPREHSSFTDHRDHASFDPGSGDPKQLTFLEVVVVNLATGEVTSVGPRVAGDVNPVSWLPDGSALLINRYDAGA